VKRSEALAPLSRDHHVALVAAQQLTRATDASAPAAVQGFLAFWLDHGRRHFVIEEELLLPHLRPAAVEERAEVMRVIVDHTWIRRAAHDLAETEADLERLHELGRRLTEHVRFEERVLFPALEGELEPDALDRLGRAVSEAERRG
jgi:hemerythrin-like domain-containing protein